METMGGIPKNRGAAVGSVAKVPPRPPSIAALVYTQAQQRKGNFTALEIYLVQDCSDLLPRRRCHKGLQATTCHHSKLVVDGTNERVDGQSHLLPVLHGILVGLHLWLSKELVKKGASSAPSPLPCNRFLRPVLGGLPLLGPRKKRSDGYFRSAGSAQVKAFFRRRVPDEKIVKNQQNIVKVGPAKM